MLGPSVLIPGGPGSPPEPLTKDSVPGYHQGGLTPPGAGPRWAGHGVSRPVVTLHDHARPAAGPRATIAVRAEHARPVGVTTPRSKTDQLPILGVAGDVAPE